ncbi:MAG TPA: hypothetical protein VFG42_19430 [Baekduia sp.]|uniref:hypothetical protein n=1 Tax=Baekduia sp. TaxID=2600305 RepID=UPI002D7A2661|nr:hypothetical protein [Baekduia sp.]HET6508975.1 hypothetical protein [Baekduia sp.]
MVAKPIVVAVAATGRSGTPDVLACAVAAARLLRAPLVLAGIAVGERPADAGERPDALRAAVARELHRQADVVPDDVPCTVHARRAASVPEGLRAVAAEEDAQLLVVGNGDRVPRGASCPVLVTPAGTSAPERPAVAAAPAPAAAPA